MPYSLQRLRLTPTDSPGQKVINWSITVDGAKIEAGYADQFGNRVELVSVEGTEHTIRITASGEVETEDRAGVFGPHQGFCPLWLFLRETALTKPGKLIRELARSLTGDSELARMHALMETIHETVAYTPGATGTETTAEQALEARTGVCQDHTHIFISAARLLDIPARYISGYLLMEGQPSKRQPMPGRKCTCRASAGSASTPPTRSARTTAMCESPPASATATAPPSPAYASARPARTSRFR